jgi:hypothetical protein
MTLPYERYNAIKWTEEFLKSLLDPKQTPRVPRAIRQRAYSLLRHYPGKYYMDVLATKCPSILETQDPVDDLSLMIYDYEAKKK